MEARLAPVRGDSFVFTEPYVYNETDTVIWPFIIQTLGVALLAIFFIMALIAPPDVAFWVVFCVFLIDVDLLGWMYILDIRANAVSFVNLVMAVGLSVDYSVHVALTVEEHYAQLKRRHEAGTGPAPTMHEAVVETLAGIGVSVIKGAWTTFLGILVIAFTSSVAFRTFFRMLSGTVLLGVIHGLTILPVLLKWATWPKLGELY
mmetsp:Transcript_4040/g.13555  ORF Transcript_4040/g.13555 Transcript_4040/m.13555 type:complete len:204 (+) Transcript_4040:3-614(+)